MATKKKAKSVPRIPAKKVVTKGTKFKRKNADGTNGRKGRKPMAIWIDANPLVDLFTKGPAPRIVLKLMKQAVGRFDEKAFASFVHEVLGNLSQEQRNKLLKRYYPKASNKLSEKDRKALRIGRAALRQMK